MKEICFLTEAFGGIATYTDYLFENLRQLETYDLTMLSLTYDHIFTGFEKQGTKSQKKIFHINSYDEISNELGDEIIYSTADILHFQHEFNIFRSNFYFLELLDRIKYTTNKIIIVTFHTIFTSPLKCQFYLNCAAVSDCMIVHQKNAKQFLVKIGIEPEKIVVIPHGTSQRIHYNISHKFYGKNKIKILLSGFITPAKSFDQGLLSLISHPGFEIVVAGLVKDEETLKKIQVLEHRSLADLHIIPRFLEEEELLSLLYDADYLVLPYNQKYYSSSGMLHLGISADLIPIMSSSPKFEELTQRLPMCEVHDGNYKGVILEIEKHNLKKRIIKILIEFAEETSWQNIALITQKQYDSLIMKAKLEVLSEI